MVGMEGGLKSRRCGELFSHNFTERNGLSSYISLVGTREKFTLPNKVQKIKAFIFHFTEKEGESISFQNHISI